MTAGYTEFEFDLPGALLSHLVGKLDTLTAAPLTLSALASVPEAQGVYQLYLGQQLVYIGKTDAEAGLRRRLERHGKKIQHRRGLNPADVRFKAVRIYVFTAVDLETLLIAHYGGLPAVPWNGSGFGSNDPGRERDTTTYKQGHFDATYPINIDHQLNISLPASASAAGVLTILKNSLPYVLRFETSGARSRHPHPDLAATSVNVPLGLPPTARGILTTVVPQLPPGWQATELPSHIILYKETRNYPQGKVIAQS